VSAVDRCRRENNSPRLNAVRNAAYDDASGSFKTPTLSAKAIQRFTRVPVSDVLPQLVLLLLLLLLIRRFRISHHLAQNPNVNC